MPWVFAVGASTPSDVPRELVRDSELDPSDELPLVEPLPDDDSLDIYANESDAKTKNENSKKSKKDINSKILQAYYKKQNGTSENRTAKFKPTRSLAKIGAMKETNQQAKSGETKDGEGETEQAKNEQA